MLLLLSFDSGIMKDNLNILATFLSNKKFLRRTAADEKHILIIIWYREKKCKYEWHLYAGRKRPEKSGTSGMLPPLKMPFAGNRKIKNRQSPKQAISEKSSPASPSPHKVLDTMYSS